MYLAFNYRSHFYCLFSFKSSSRAAFVIDTTAQPIFSANSLDVNCDASSSSSLVLIDGFLNLYPIFAAARLSVSDETSRLSSALALVQSLCLFKKTIALSIS